MRWTLILSLLLVLASCNKASAYKNVSVSDLHGASETKLVLLDVRQPDEFAEGHVQGSRLIPLGELEARTAELPDDQPIYVICRSGNRSKTASQILNKAGKKDVRNVQGGILAWVAAGYPVQR